MYRESVRASSGLRVYQQLEAISDIGATTSR